MTQTREEFIQSIADELRCGDDVHESANVSYDIKDVHDFICGRMDLCERLATINTIASLSPQDAQGTQYKLDKLFDEAAYSYAAIIADDVAEYRRSGSLDAVEGGHDE